MSVEFYYTVAYGSAGTFESADDLPGKLKGMDLEDLYEGNLPIALPPHVQLTIGGDQMSGPRRWALTLTRPYKRVGKYSELELVTNLEPITTTDAMELGEAIFALELPSDIPCGWMLLTDVS